MRLIAWLALLVFAAPMNADEKPNARRPKSDADLQFWLANMTHHRFSDAEITAAIGLTADEIAEARRRFDLTLPPREKLNGRLRVLPYPGGRHPRIGFLDGAVRPQRETKFSVFAPWDDSAYVVADIPEAIWCQQGLLYLAHEHVPTLWTKQKIELPPLEWQRRDDSSLSIERKLPNDVVFAATITPTTEAVRMELTLTNGSQEKLSDLRVQNCVMLKGMPGFDAQTNDNKIFRGPYAVCRSADGKKWVITGWEPIHRAWGNPPCPCLHADPKFPDCAPGEMQRLRGWLSFYEGADLDAELKRIDAIGWRR